MTAGETAPILLKSAIVILRDYQQKAVDSIYDYLRERAGNPCAVIPTAGGKTPVIATLCRDAVINWNGRVLILAHVKELLQQTAEKLQAICPTVKVGLYSAGLKRRETDAPVIVAGIQSVHDKAAMLGRFDLVIVDETHLIGEEGMYRELIAALQVINPDLRVIGLTATPYRLSSGAICKPDGILQEICFEVSVKVLMNRGFLSKMVSKAGAAQADTSLLRIVRGEFDQGQAEVLFDSITKAATEEVLEKTVDRRSVLIFCQNVNHARGVAAIIRSKGSALAGEADRQLAPVRDIGEVVRLDDLFSVGAAADWLDDRGLPAEAVRYELGGAFSVAEIYGDTPPAKRARILEDFKSGSLKYLVNVNVLTTGFDAPNIDSVVLLRATVSPGLYYQMVGRGFRICEGKTDCLVLDFGENVKRHGPVDCIKPRADRGRRIDAGKECPTCHSVMAMNASVCLDCGFSWENAAGEAQGHGATASEDDVISGSPKTESHDVFATTYKVHTKKGAAEGAPKTLRVTYQVAVDEWVSEWVCVEHAEGSFAWRKAETWWMQRCHLPMPGSAAEAFAIASQGWLAETESVSVKRTPGKDFPEITKYTLGRLPRSIPPCPTCDSNAGQLIVPSTDSKFAGRVICPGFGPCEHLYRYATAEEVSAFGVFDPPTDRWRGEIRYRLDPDKLPPEKPDAELFDGVEAPDEIPF